jgi:oxygen-independent coproporphyrinogen-3 oxidase
MKPDRLAVFSYAHVPWIKPAQKILEEKGAAHARDQARSC